MNAHDKFSEDSHEWNHKCSKLSACQRHLRWTELCLRACRDEIAAADRREEDLLQENDKLQKGRDKLIARQDELERIELARSGLVCSLTDQRWELRNKLGRGVRSLQACRNDLKLAEREREELRHKLGVCQEKLALANRREEDLLQRNSNLREGWDKTYGELTKLRSGEPEKDYAEAIRQLQNRSKELCHATSACDYMRKEKFEAMKRAEVLAGQLAEAREMVNYLTTKNRELQDENDSLLDSSWR